MKLSFLFALLLLPFAALAQSETCPRVWRSGDSLLTDPAPHIQWLREGQAIPGANERWLLPTEAGRYSVESASTPSPTYAYRQDYALAGYVFDELHRPVAGATVRRGSFTATTDEKGRFILSVDETKPAAETPVVVTVEKDGYWRNASRQYVSRFYTTETRIMLHSQRVTNRVDATKGGEMAYRGFTLHMPPNAVQTESGTPYNGTILLSVEGATPADPDFGLRMPGGDFAAIDEGGNDVLLYSYGYLSAEMKTESGEKLELRPEARATLRFQLPYTETNLSDSVPLWHFNTESAVWEQEGWSFRNGSIYEGEVSHFSSWNCDVPAERSTVRGRIFDCNDEPVKGAWVSVGQRQAVADSLGNYWSFVPGDLAFDVWTQSDTLRNITVPTQQERTLEDLTGRDFGGLAVWNPAEEALIVNLWGNTPENLRLSIDGGQSWTEERAFAGVERAPEAVLLEGVCSDRLRVYVLPRAEDCRMLDSLGLEFGRWYESWPAALTSEEVVNRISFQPGGFGGRWDLLFGFSCLQELRLQVSSISALPPSIGSLTALQSLYLSFNSLSSLPESIYSLSNLRILGIENNNLTAIPENIGRLAKLRYLSLAINSLSSLPESIGNLTDLQELHVSGNNLTTLPESIGKLTVLQELSWDQNGLTELPEIIGDLTGLRKLHLNQNSLASLPESIGNLTALQTLNLNDNGLTSLPESFGNLVAMQELNLSRNSLTSLPASIGNLSALQQLQLRNNQLSSLPESFGNLTALQDLWIEGNVLISLPESIGSLTALKSLSLGSNSLTSLPNSIGNLTALQSLSLANNGLTDLPDSIGNLAGSLEFLDLNGNPIPAERQDAIQDLLPNTFITW